MKIRKLQKDALLIGTTIEEDTRLNTLMGDRDEAIVSLKQDLTGMYLEFTTVNEDFDDDFDWEDYSSNE